MWIEGPRRPGVLSAAVAVLLEAALATAQPTSGVERGAYIVHHVAMCVQCHSPRDEGGELIESRLFSGGKIPFPSPFPGQEWAYEAPALAGLPALQEGEVVVLLSTGRRPSGESPRPPMPPFRLSPDDAEAVVEYLKSLPLPHR